MSNIKQKFIVKLPTELRDAIHGGLDMFGKVKVVGLGIFETKEVPSRPGRNPQTGEMMTIPSYYKIKYRPTASLKEKICKNR